MRPQLTGVIGRFVVVFERRLEPEASLELHAGLWALLDLLENMVLEPMLPRLDAQVLLGLENGVEHGKGVCVPMLVRLVVFVLVWIVENVVSRLFDLFGGLLSTLEADICAEVALGTAITGAGLHTRNVDFGLVEEYWSDDQRLRWSNSQ